MDTVSGVLGVDEAAQVLAEAVIQMASPTQAPVTRARLTLTLVYSDEVRQAHLRLVRELTQVLESAGVASPADRAVQVAAFIDGTLLHVLTVSARPPERSTLAAAIRALLG